MIAGDTESDDFEIVLNEDQEFAGDIDAFLIKLCRNQPSPEITADGGNFLCEGDSVVLDAGDGYTGQVTHLVKSLQSGTAPSIVTAQDGLTSIELCEAAKRSIEAGERVTV